MVTDTQFFNALPVFSPTIAVNSEFSWLKYKIGKKGDNYELENVDVVHSEWDEVRNALREGTPPDPDEIFTELHSILDNKKKMPKVIKV